MKRAVRNIKIMAVLLIIASVILSNMVCIVHNARMVREPHEFEIGGYDEYENMTFPGMYIISILQLLLLFGKNKVVYTVCTLLSFVRMSIHCLDIPFYDLFESRFGGLYTHSYNLTVYGYCVKYISIFVMLLSALLLLSCFRKKTTEIEK